jgi:alpha-beta hydrolase superfamily lysophospholipase
VKPIELEIDVTGRTGLPGTLHTAVSVFVPDRQRRLSPPLVVFGFPGGGYARGYFHIEWPGLSGYSQAEHHLRAGFFFVACDHLGVGQSSLPDPAALDFRTVPAANRATVETVMERLESGTLVPGLEPLRGATVIGMGQSMGGCFLVVQQAQRPCYDAIAVLGYSAIQTVLPVPPGGGAALPRAEAFRYGFHWDDVPRALVAADMEGGYPQRGDRLPPWASRTVPGCATSMLEPGRIAREAAAIDVPVFIGVGERDVCPDPHAEPAAYRSARDVTLWVQPRAAHMHNFAGTRELLWDRLAVWALGIGAQRFAGR